MKKIIFALCLLLVVGVGSAFGQSFGQVNADRMTVYDAFVNEGSNTVKGAEAVDASIVLDADEGDDLADTWTIQSQASTNLLRFLNDTTAVLTLSTGGVLVAGNGTAAAPTYSFTGNSNMGFYRFGADDIGISVGGAAVGRITSGLFGLGSLNMTWGSSAGSLTGPVLAREGDAILSQMNATNAQEFRVYNTDSGANDEYGTLKWATNLLSIGSVKTGTGTLRNVEILAAETVIGSIKADGTGKAVCIKADQSLGTCTDAVGVGGTCTCS